MNTAGSRGKRGADAATEGGGAVGGRQSRSPPVPGLRPASVCFLHVLSSVHRPSVLHPSVRLPRTTLRPGHVRALHRGAQRRPWGGGLSGTREGGAPGEAWAAWGRHQPLTPVTQCPLHKAGTVVLAVIAGRECAHEGGLNGSVGWWSRRLRVRACVRTYVRACVRGPGRAAWFRLPLWAQGLVVAPVLC